MQLKKMHKECKTNHIRKPVNATRIKIGKLIADIYN